jgi:LmbE family N-acetylglucosaminyl deacetylase
MAKKDVVMAFCAHNDDHTLGAGGTLAKYAKEGKEIVIVIFSYGESSHAWLKKKEVVKMRVKEALRSDKVFKVKKTYFLGLSEGNFEEEFYKRHLDKRIKSLIKILKPSKIFTHSYDDPHPDHRAVYNLLVKHVDEVKHKCDIFSFDIWNPFNIRKRDSPKLVVDITDTFKLKLRAFDLHKSQWMTKIVMIPLTYVRALSNGLARDYKFAEVFYKLR